MYFNDLSLFSNRTSSGGIYNSELLVVDAAILLSTLAVLCHVFVHTRSDGVVLVLTTLCMGTLVELTRVYLLSTHCHAEASIMIGPCCSVTSILYYMCWMYSCYAIGNRVPLQSKFARVLLVASLHPLFSIMYQTMAANSGWLTWSSTASPSGNKLLQVKFSALIGGITGQGDKEFLRMIEQSMQERILGVPVIAVMYDFFFGVAFHWCRSIAKRIVDSDSQQLRAMRRKRTDKEEEFEGKVQGSMNIGTISAMILDSLTEILFVSVMAPLVALLQLALLVLISIGGLGERLAKCLPQTYFASVTNVLIATAGKHHGLWLKAMSTSVVVASIIAVFADPIFRQLNKRHMITLSSNAQLVAEGVSSNQGVSVVRNIASGLYVALTGGDADRDLWLMSIPYIFFAAIAYLALYQIYIDYMLDLPLWDILKPYRVVSLVCGNIATFIFTYFNFSQLKWNVAQTALGQEPLLRTTKSTVFKAISPNRVLQPILQGQNKTTVVRESSGTSSTEIPRPLNLEPLQNDSNIEKLKSEKERVIPLASDSVSVLTTPDKMSEVTTEPRSTGSMASTASVASSSSRRKKRSKKAAVLVSNTENVGEKSPEHALLRRSQGTDSTDSIASLASEISVASAASDADRETQLPIDLDDMNTSSDSDSGIPNRYSLGSSSQRTSTGSNTSKSSRRQAFRKGSKQ